MYYRSKRVIEIAKNVKKLSEWQNIRRIKFVKRMLNETYYVFILISVLLDIKNIIDSTMFVIKLINLTRLNILNMPVEVFTDYLLLILKVLTRSFVLYFCCFCLMCLLNIYYNKKKLKQATLSLYRVEILRHRKMRLMFSLMLGENNNLLIMKHRILSIKSLDRDLIKLNKRYRRIYTPLSTIDKVIVSEVLYKKLKTSYFFALPYYISNNKKKP